MVDAPKFNDWRAEVFMRRPKNLNAVRKIYGLSEKFMVCPKNLHAIRSLMIDAPTFKG